MKIEKVLVTGATGFVGSHMIDYLLDELSIEAHGTIRPRSRSEFIRKEATYHEADILDARSMTKLITTLKPQAIVHLAAQSFVPLSWIAPEVTFQTNVIGTLNILNAVSASGMDTIVHVAGSSEEYGLVSQENLPINEHCPLRPQSPYGVSKVAADLLAQQYHRSYGMNVVISRAFNHTGPGRGQSFVESKIAHHFALEKLGRDPGPLRLGNVSAVRDYTNVLDMVMAYWLLINSGYIGVPLNIGTGTGFPISAIVRFFTHDLPETQCLNVQLEADNKLVRPSEVPVLVCDSSKFRELTGWSPLSTFEETLESLYQYWLKVER